MTIWSPSLRWLWRPRSCSRCRRSCSSARRASIIGADTASLRDASGVKRLLGRLVRNRTWLAGWLTNLGGVGTQAAALKVGSVAAVQPMMAAQLLFVLSLASGEQRRWPSRRDWLSALAVCAGLVLLLTADASSLTGEPHRNRVFMATVCVVSLVLILRQVSRHTFPWLAGLLVGVAAGLCHALNAVYLKLTVEDLFHGRGTGHALRLARLRAGRDRTERNVVGTDSFCQRSATARRRRHGRYQPGRQLRIGNPRLRRTCSPRPRRAVGHRRVGLLIALGIVGLANASSTRRLYWPDTESGGPFTTDTVDADHGGVGRQRCS